MTMALASKPYRHAALAAAVVVASTAVTAPSRVARADDVSPTGKGIAGGALLGAEVVTMVEAIAGVRPGWAYAVGAIVGAGGGGVGGYFAEQGSTDGKVPMYLLAGGLALVIPAVVLTLNATRYMPEEGTTEDNAPTGPSAEPGVPGGSVGAGAPAGAPAPAPASPAPAPAPQSLLPAGTPSRSPSRLSVGAPAPTGPTPTAMFDLSPKTLRIGVPGAEVRPVFSVAEQRQYGMQGGTELRLPVVHVAF
jgi:hypothetical protein